MPGGNTQGGRHFFNVQLQELGQFLGGRLTLEFLFQMGISFLNTIGEANLIEGKTNDPGLFGERLQNALTDPPYSIRNELKSSRFIKTLGSFD